ncbi:DUF3365 domain-containing protein [Pseudomonadota bacterium]
MGLRLKFNLVLTIVFLAGLMLAGVFFNNTLQKNAREEVHNTANLMLASALAVREYTVKEIRPLLAVQMQHEFLPQTVPAYGATTNITKLRAQYPDYSYKEAALNPTNPVNRATDWEADVIAWFQDHPDEKEFVGERQSPTGPSLFISRPILIKQPGCLGCHGDSSSAPKTLLAKYGSSNGFGWKLNEIIGSQIVSVPMSVPLKRAESALVVFMGSLVGVFLIIAIVLNILLHNIVIKPVRAMALVANHVSMGKRAPEFKTSGKDEIASLATSFNRMRRSLSKAMKMLDDSQR